MPNKMLFSSGGAKLDLVVGPATVFLINFSSRDKRQGDGTRCMNLAIAWADANGRTMRLEADPPPREGLMNSEQLVEFYKRFGFVEDTSWSGSKPVRMIRVVR